MNEHVKRIQKPRCFLLYALAPSGLPAAEANRLLNAFIGDPGLPLAIFHDHFIGQPGGIVIFYAETTEERDALLSQNYLDGWQVEIQPLIFSHSPSADRKSTRLNSSHGYISYAVFCLKKKKKKKKQRKYR